LLGRRSQNAVKKEPGHAWLFSALQGPSKPYQEYGILCWSTGNHPLANAANQIGLPFIHAAGTRGGVDEGKPVIRLVEAIVQKGLEADQGLVVVAAPQEHLRQPERQFTVLDIFLSHHLQQLQAALVVLLPGQYRREQLERPHVLGLLMQDGAALDLGSAK